MATFGRNTFVISAEATPKIRRNRFLDGDFDAPLSILTILPFLRVSSTGSRFRSLFAKVSRKALKSTLENER